MTSTDADLEPVWGQPTTLTCRMIGIYGSTSDMVEWYRNGTELSGSDDRYKISSNDDNWGADTTFYLTIIDPSECYIAWV